MLKLRKILLSDIPFITLLIIVLLITIIRLNIPKKSIFNENSKESTGIITKIIVKNDKTSIYIKNKETIIATTYKEIKDLSLGDKVRVEGEFIKPNSNTTEYLFNYKKYLQNKNIFYLVKISKIQKISSNKNIYYYLKQILINRMNNNPYLYTFVLGDKTYIDQEVIRSFQANGISHLFAISGMHITLLVSLINRILKKIKIKEEKRYILTTIFLLTYLSLVGLSASILRGILFYVLFTINNIKYFYIKSTNLFILTVSISLLINPYYIYEVGYQYSYLISLSLLELSSFLKSNNYFISLIKVSITSFIVSLPITLYNFYEINLLSIIYNLLFVPFISIIIFPSSLIVLLITPLQPVFNYLIYILEKVSIFLGNISMFKLVFKRTSFIFYITYLTIILLFIFGKKKKILILLLVVLTIHYFIPYFDGSDYIKMIDVGQGDSILLHSNNKNILIDTGGNSSYDNNDGIIFYNTILPILKSNGIKKIDYLIITHGDKDHIGEAINLVKNFKVDKVIFNCGSYNYLENELIKVLDTKNKEYYSCIKELNVDTNKLYFLNTIEYDNENDNSSVIYTELNNYKFLFMADASTLTEKEILDRYNLPNIDVLKVGHHGSRTSSGKEFIDTINPKYSLISVGKNNKYAHPNKEALDNLSDSKIYRTDQDGSIMFKIKKNKLKIETCPP